MGLLSLSILLRAKDTQTPRSRALLLAAVPGHQALCDRSRRREGAQSQAEGVNSALHSFRSLLEVSGSA